MVGTESHKVLLLGSLDDNPESLKAKREELLNINPNMQVEMVERVINGEFQSDQQFDLIYFNVVEPYKSELSSTLVKKIFDFLKLDGQIETNNTKDIENNLKLNGMIDIVKTEFQNYIQFKAKRPSYDKVQKLSLKKKSDKKKFLWAKEEDLINDNDLLDEQDFVKPDSATLCAPDTKDKKKKACKNCTCGLAEIEAQEEQETKELPKSSCGSCYLGDAFRCSSCPYLGMPAFKQGQKVELAGNMLQDDIEL